MMLSEVKATRINTIEKDIDKRYYQYQEIYK